jgi:hypothetical protein
MLPIHELTPKSGTIMQAIKIIPICMHCKNIRDDDGVWNKYEESIHENPETTFTHGICPSCREEHYTELEL